MDAGASWQRGMPAFGETSPALRPWETHPAMSRREGERCPLLESSVSQTPGAEIPSLPWGGLHPGFAKAPLALPGNAPRAQPSPAPQPWGSAPTLQLWWGSSAYWVKTLKVLQKGVFLSSLPHCSPHGEAQLCPLLLQPCFRQLWIFSPHYPKIAKTTYFTGQTPLKIHLLAPLAARYLALSVQPCGSSAACSDLDLSDCQ